MLNTINYNSAMYNALGASTSLTPSAVEFNGYAMQTSEIIITKLVHENTPIRDFIRRARPYDNGQNILSDYWRTKTIVMEGVIKTSTAEELDLKLDEFKKNISGQRGTLNVEYGEGYRSYICTLDSGQSMFDRQAHNITFLPFRLTFACDEPFGTDKNYTSIFYSGTSLVTTLSQTNSGSAVAKPIYTFNFSAASGVTNVLIENTTSGESIQYAGNITAPALLEFNAEEREVTLNGIAVDYSGQFPGLVTGVNSVRITITGVSATYTFTAQHKNAYL